MVRKTLLLLMIFMALVFLIDLRTEEESQWVEVIETGPAGVEKPDWVSIFTAKGIKRLNYYEVRNSDNVWINLKKGEMISLHKHIKYFQLFGYKFGERYFYDISKLNDERRRRPTRLVVFIFFARRAYFSRV